MNVGHVVLFVLGLILIAAATLLYSGEEKRLQNRIEDLWLLASELRPTSETRLTAIVAAAATLVLRIIDRCFGRNLIAFSALASALITSTFSFLIVMLIVVGLDPKRVEVLVIATVVTGLTVWFQKIRIPAAILLVAGTVWMATTQAANPAVIIVIYIGAATDIGTILLIRTILRRFLTLKTFRAAIILLIAHAALLAITVVPIAVLYYSTELPERWPTTLLYANGWALTNAFVVIVASALISVLLLMAVHRLLWPLMERALYRIATFGVFEHRKVLFTAGVALICASSTSLAAVVGVARKIVGL